MTFESQFRFPVSEPPWSTNEDRNLHPQARARRISAWKEATIVYYRQQTPPEQRAKDPGIVRVHIPFTMNRRRDPHNYCGTVVKAVIDGLVKAGAWPDDTPDYVGHREPVLYVGTEVIVEIFPMDPYRVRSKQ